MTNMQDTDQEPVHSASDYDMTWFYGCVLIGLTLWGAMALWGVA